MKWDKTKKKYTLQKVDRDGKTMRNESGAKIKKGEEKLDIYKRWTQKTHLKLQKSGEIEDKKLTSQAKSANEARGLMKQFKGRHKDLMKGEDMRDNKAMLEKKGKRMFDKIRNDKSGAGGFKRKDKDGKRIYSPKTMAKLNKGAGFSRSKMIVRVKTPAKGGAKGRR